MLIRRSRLGAGLFDAALGLAVAAIAGALLLEAARHYATRAGAQAQARILSAFADGAREFATRDITGLRDRLAASASRAEAITEAQLRAARLLPDGLPTRAPSGGGIAAAAWLPGSGAAEPRIIIAAWSRAAPGDRALPLGEPGTAHAGRLGGACRSASTVCGGGLDWDAAGLIAALSLELGAAAAPRRRDMLALRIAHLDADREPYLHRVAVPGAPELNRAEGDFAMGGADLPAPEIRARIVAIENDLEATGTIEAASLAVGAGAAFSGEAAIAGSIDGEGGDAAGFSVSGGISAAAAEIAVRIEATSFDGSLAAESIRIEGALSLPAGTTVTVAASGGAGGAFAADTLEAPLLEVDDLETGLASTPAVVSLTGDLIIRSGAAGYFNRLAITP
ncbi:MAG: hypothetical protein OXI87_05795 [Albidovulum sp.]|nr:hypothetical protein [Albidovulum sp.]MDE0533758.1 hypothetical protein [Albidovulum sp.]